MVNLSDFFNLSTTVFIPDSKTINSFLVIRLSILLIWHCTINAIIAHIEYTESLSLRLFAQLYYRRENIVFLNLQKVPIKQNKILCI